MVQRDNFYNFVMMEQIINDTLENLTDDFCKERGTEVAELRPIPSGGSSRRYTLVLLKDGFSLIGCRGESPEENRAFVSLAELFGTHRLNAPEIYAVSDDNLCYIQENLGNHDLLGLLKEEPEAGFRMAREIIGSLPEFQTLPEDEWGDKVFNSPFDKIQITDDLHYFKYCFLKGCGLDVDDRKLEDELSELADMIAGLPEEGRGLMLRDFQSRNVMVNGEDWGLIDFQGARKGPLLYDPASFAWQSRAGFTPEQRRLLVRDYFEGLKEIRELDGATMERLEALLPAVVLLRQLQTLGAYGFRGLIQKKAQFITVIPAALKEIVRLLEDAYESGCPSGWALDPKTRWPELCRLIGLACEKFAESASVDEDGKLHVSVISFSYKKGYPIDLSGNGGGFMFDCRGLHNPGRYAEYKDLTGRDREVQEFLEKYTEVEDFINEAYAMVSHSVAVYARRGFTSLQVGFGCTGGQHRSVYCAEILAGRLRDQFPEIVVSLTHREQGI